MTLMKEKQISLWFLIGLQLAIYGVLIGGAGIYDWLHPAADTGVVLSKLHAGVWLSLVMFAMGLVYIVKYRPRK